MENGYRLISLDVVSLFTNIPIELAIDCVSNRWNYITNETDLPKSEFVTAVKLVMRSTYFIFNGKIYLQLHGTPMNSPLSPIIADIVMQDIESRALNTINCRLPFYFRFVDDMFTAVLAERIDGILNTFNSINSRLQFTIELENNNTISFLEVAITLEGKKLIFDWYHKPTYSGRYLNFLSIHPDCQKRGTICSLLDRAFTLSHPKFHQKNIILIINTLNNNGYPLKFIFDTINQRLPYLIHKSNNTKNNLDTVINSTSDLQDESEPVSYFTVPYLPRLTSKLRNILENTNTRLSYFSLNKLDSIVKAHKDVIPKQFNMNVIYKIDCKDCDASYVGQTGTKLITRVNEHRKT